MVTENQPDRCMPDPDKGKTGSVAIFRISEYAAELEASAQGLADPTAD